MTSSAASANPPSDNPPSGPDEAPASTAGGKTLVEFSLSRQVPLTPEVAWQMLTDWKGHEQWIPMTKVAVDPDDPSSFIAWSGLGRLALEDRMKAEQPTFDGTTGHCRVAKLGPVLVGEAEFTVVPGPDATTAIVSWREAVTVPLLPRFMAPVVGRVGAALFSHSLGRMGRHGNR